MKKKLNEKAVMNELRGESKYFPSPPPKKTPSKQARRVTVMPQKDAVLDKTTDTVNKYTDMNETTNEQTNVTTKQQSIERKKIRHTFDIFGDQLLSLREITIEREKKFHKRVKIGDLAQEAFDMFITRERNKK